MKKVKEVVYNFKKGEIWHQDNAGDLPCDLQTAYFRKPISEEEDRLYRGKDGEPYEISDNNVCTKSFKVRITVYE